MIKAFKLKFHIHPLFLLLGLVMAFCGQGLIFLNYFVVISLHEMGHFVVAKRLGYRLSNFCLLPQGALLSGQDQFFSYSDEIKVAIAGPLVNACLCICTVASWWVWPITYAYTNVFAFCNLSTAIFNFIPILPLDGGRIVLAFASSRKKRKVALKICNSIGFMLAGLFLLFFVKSCFVSFNPTFLIISIFIITGIISSTKEFVYVNGFSKEVKIKQMKKGIKVKSVVINENVLLSSLIPLLSSHEYNIVYLSNDFMEITGVVHECEIEHILEKFSISEPIKNCVK